MDEKTLEILIQLEPEQLRARLTEMSTSELREIARAVAHKLQGKS